MHNDVIKFCSRIRDTFPFFFVGKRVLDIGSLDINGTNRYLFTDCEYIGVDIAEGKNVDFVASARDFWRTYPDHGFDVVICTEVLEHDEEWTETLDAAIELLNSGSLLLITCASYGRPEHGTTEHRPEDSPLTNAYYHNLRAEELLTQRDFEKTFFPFAIEYGGNNDLYFYGIKR